MHLKLLLTICCLIGSAFTSKLGTAGSDQVGLEGSYREEVALRVEENDPMHTSENIKPESCDTKNPVSKCDFAQRDGLDKYGNNKFRRMSIAVYEKVCNEDFQIVLTNGKPNETYTIKYYSMFVKIAPVSFNLTVKPGERFTSRKGFERARIINPSYLSVKDKFGKPLLEECRVAKCSKPKEFMKCYVKSEKRGNSGVETGVLYGYLSKCSDGVNTAFFFLNRNVYGPNKPIIELRTPNDLETFARGDMEFDANRKTLSSKPMPFEFHNGFNVHIFAKNSKHTICKHRVNRCDPVLNVKSCCLLYTENKSPASHADDVFKRDAMPKTMPRRCSHSILISKTEFCDYNLRLNHNTPVLANLTLSAVGKGVAGQALQFDVEQVSPQDIQIPEEKQDFIENFHVFATYVPKDKLTPTRECELN